MKREFSFRRAAAACAIALLVSACGDDGSPASSGVGDTGSVSGTVTFLGGAAAWPSAGNIQVSAYSFIRNPPGVPTGPPDGFTDPIAPADSYDFQIDGLATGSYDAVFVSWRDPANPSAARVIGVYWAFVDSVGVAGDPPAPVPPGPTPIAIQKDQVTGAIDIVADLSLIP